MASVVAKTSIRREPGFLYYLDKQGDVSRVGSGRQVKKRPQKVAKIGVRNAS